MALAQHLRSVYFQRLFFTSLKHCQFPHVCIFVHKDFFHKATSQWNICSIVLFPQFLYTKILLSSAGKQVWLFFVSSSLCKGLRHEEISDRFLSVSPLLCYRGKTIESHCLDDDSALKKRNLFSRSIHSMIVIVEFQAENFVSYF